MAAGAINTARQLGYGIGIAVLGTVFASRAAHSLPGAPASVAHDLAGGQAPRLLAQAGPNRAALDAALHRASISGIDGAWLVAGISGVLAGLLVWALVRPQPNAPAPEWSAARTEPAAAVAD
ncbi:MAG TPA: hypothetical protein VHB92_10645, partial [Humibacter sp.]|nr:hypothetical protein [Humibacter sp.]